MYCISARAQYVRCFVKCVCVMFYDMFFILYFPRLCLFFSLTSEDLNSMDVSIVSFFLQMWESVYLCHQSTGFNFILFGKLATRFLCFISRKQQDKNRNKKKWKKVYTHNDRLLNDRRRFRMFMCSITATFILCFRSIFNLWTRKTRHRFIRCCKCSGWNLIRMSILIVYNWLDGIKRKYSVKNEQKKNMTKDELTRGWLHIKTEDVISFIVFVFYFLV